MAATNTPLSLSKSLMTLTLLNLHACPVTLPVIQDETLPVAFDSTVSFTYFCDLCLRLLLLQCPCFCSCEYISFFLVVSSLLVKLLK